MTPQAPTLAMPTTKLTSVKRNRFSEQPKNGDKKQVYRVVDTSVFLHEPRSLTELAGDEHTTLFIPEQVLQELDNHKRGPEEINRNARETVRELRKLTEQARLTHGSKRTLVQGVTTSEGGTIRLILTTPEAKQFQGDDCILETTKAECKRLRLNHDQITIITKDGLLAFKAQAYGFKDEDYLRDKVDALPTSIPIVKLTNADLQAINQKTGFRNGECNLPQFFQRYTPTNPNLTPGYIILEGNDEHQRYLAFVDEPGDVRLIIDRAPLNNQQSKQSIRTKNIEQKAALDALMDTQNHLVCLLGPAGTGKTILATAAAINSHPSTNPPSAVLPNRVAHGPENDDDDKTFRIIISRPMVSVGKEMGFLPGDADAKMDPWMQPIYDNLEVLLGPEKAQQMVEKGVIRLQPIPLIRGRSLRNCVIVIDEAQNLTPKEMKAIVTRAGRNCRIFLCGDVTQIDHPYLDMHSNGLSYVAKRMGHLPIVSVIPLVTTVRSELSEAAANCL